MTVLAAAAIETIEKAVVRRMKLLMEVSQSVGDVFRIGCIPESVVRGR